MNRNAADWIRALKLRPHPEGGWYAETYRSADIWPPGTLPARYRGSRAASTAIYFLLEGRRISALHRLASDELWFFHAGATLRLDLIGPDGEARRLRLGARRCRGPCLPQAVLPSGWWFGASIERGRGFALVSCTVAPGFDFSDFEIGRRADLLARHPARAAVIRALTAP